jgi:hypothetical protein
VTDFIESLHLAEVRDSSIAVLEGNLRDYEEDEDGDEAEDDAADEDDDDDDDDPEIHQ